jgi:hypothetical protein
MDQQVVGWRKSSHSGDGANCVEVAAPGDVLIRDTTDRTGFTLALPAAAWTAFLTAVR